MRKRFLLLFLTIISVICLAFGVSACSNISSNSNDSSSSNSSSDASSTENKQYTVIFDANGGTFADGESTYTLKIDESLTLSVPASPTRNGYTFDEWQYNGSVWDFADGISSDITLVAVWTANEYNVTFDSNGGSEIAAETVTYDATYNFAVPEKGSYTFNGWKTADGTMLTDNEGKALSVWNITEDTTLYADWSATEYTISYVNADSATNNNPAKYTIEDSTITLVDAEKDGYTFVGWYSDADLMQRVTEIDTSSAADITIYAKWTVIEYTASFYADGQLIDNVKFTVENESIAEPSVPDKTGYSGAWETYTISASDLTINAVYTPINYTITYEGIKSATNSNPVTYTIESEIIILSDISADGYTFLGWYDGDDKVTEVAAGSYGDISLTAKWEVVEYSISYENTKNTTNSNSTTYTIESETITLADISATGYTFLGWYNGDNKVTEIATGSYGNLTLTAKWEAVTYTISYGNTKEAINSNPINYTIESSTIALSDISADGYTFLGWYDGDNKVTEITAGSYDNITLTAKWEAIVYTITYEYDDTIGGSADGVTLKTTYTIEDEFTFEELINKTVGYTFDGWYSDSNYTTAVITIAGGSTGNLTIYGKFTANTYTVWLDGNEEANVTVTFDLNGASGTAPAAQTITETTTLTYPDVPTCSGYLFAGWYTTADCTGAIFDFSDYIASDLTLYAKWIDLNGANGIEINGTATVTLSGTTEQVYYFVPVASGNVSITTTGSIDTLGMLYKDGTLLKQDDDSGSDSNFLITYNVTAGEVYEIRVRGFSSSTSGDIILSVSGSNTVADGGYTRDVNKTTITYGSTDYTLTVPATEGDYKFLGWADVNGVYYTDENGYAIRAWDIAEDTTLYSQWEKMEYTVTFVVNGGTEVESITLEYGARLDLTLYTTTRDGYTFGGWYLSAADTDSYNASTMPDENITLYAKWITYSLGSIKYDEDKLAISVYDEINADLFSALCIDTDGMPVTITVTVSGTQAAGETITVRLVATNNGKTAQKTISGIQVYGDPTLTVTNADIGYVNLAEMDGDWFDASGTDTFGEATTITVHVADGYSAGDIATVYIDSTDAAGNVTTQAIENVALWGTPIITYNTEKTAISVDDTISADLFSETAVDSFGESLTVTASLFEGTFSSGNSIVILLTATDSKSNVNNTYVSVKVYGAPVISDAATTDFTESDVIDVDSLDITATDTYGESLDITLTLTSGTQVGGNTMVYTATVTDAAGNVTTKNISVKIYGTPTITVGRTAVTVDETIALKSFSAKAKDSFDTSLTVTYEYVSGTQTSGTYMTYKFTATDKLGNTLTITETIAVYDIDDISFTYSNMASDVIKLTSKGEEFFASATDSFGNACDITIEAADGYTLAAGETISLYIVATDAAGNSVYSELISGIKVYGTPAISATDDYITADTDLDWFFLAYDSFGEELSTIVTIVSGTQTSGEEIILAVTATDSLGNIAEKYYIYEVGTSSTAFEYGYYTVEFDYTNETASIISYNGSESEVIIPETIYGYTVTSIAESAFVDCTSITSIVVPDSVTSIGAGAFSGCSSLVSITLPFVGGSVSATEASASTLFGYIFGTTSYDGGTSTKQYYASSSSATYYIPTTLTTITITGGRILYGAFYGCTKLTSITIPDSVTSIGSYSFYSCTSLISLTIPSNVTSIGTCAFYNCRALTKINFNATVMNDLSSNSGVFYRAGLSGNGITVTIGANVTKIPAYLFYASIAPKITSVVFEDDSVCKSIGAYAFYNCTSLTSVYYSGTASEWASISFGVSSNPLYYAGNLYFNGMLATSITLECITTINSLVFYGYTSLTSVSIGDSVTSIGSEAFYGCTLLESVTIGDSVTSIGSDAFRNCTSLISVTIPDSVTSIGSYSFYNCTSLTSIAIPDSVTSIGSEAFYGCTLLESVTIGDSVTSIGNSAFRNCTSLTSVTIPDSVKYICMSAFYGCTSLTSVTIGNSVTSIEKWAFYNCTSLSSVTFENTSGWYVTTTGGASSGTTITVTNAGINTIYLTSSYYNYYWYRSES